MAHSPKEGEKHESALGGWWRLYEIPLTLIATAISMVIFLYSTFPTKDAVGQHFTAWEERQGRTKIYIDAQDNQLHAELVEVKKDTKDSLDGLEARMVEDRRILNTILLEVRKR